MSVSDPPQARPSSTLRSRLGVLIVILLAVFGLVALGLAAQVAVMVAGSAGLIAAEVATRLFGPTEPVGRWRSK